VKRNMLHLPARVGEAKVDVLDVLILHKFQQVIGHWNLPSSKQLL